MKKLLLLLSASSLLLVGAGCMGGASTDVQTPPVAQPPSQPPQPSTPPTGGTGAGAGVDVGGGANAGGAAAGGGANLGIKADVSITAGGTFSPAVITVKKGTTVIWTNSGSAMVQVASNPHPTHNDYPGFDSKSAIGAGETYAFTFDKAGSWGYHNHLNPTVMGTVIVTE